MILVTLGTNDKPFTRLLQEVDRLIEIGTINEDVVVQAGKTKYKSDRMKIVQLVPMSEMEKLVSECSLLITHGGVGSIISGLDHDKCVIAVPRLARYGEHVNDHQLQIIRNFRKRGYIIGLECVEELPEALEKSRDFVPDKYESNVENMIALVKGFIEQ